VSLTSPTSSSNKYVGTLSGIDIFRNTIDVSKFLLSALAPFLSSFALTYLELSLPFLLVLPSALA
jgi:hypothetical protein